MERNALVAAFAVGIHAAQCDFGLAVQLASCDVVGGERINDRLYFWLAQARHTLGSSCVQAYLGRRCPPFQIHGLRTVVLVNTRYSARERRTYVCRLRHATLSCILCRHSMGDWVRAITKQYKLPGPTSSSRLSFSSKARHHAELHAGWAD